MEVSHWLGVEGMACLLKPSVGASSLLVARQPRGQAGQFMSSLAHRSKEILAICSSERPTQAQQVLAATLRYSRERLPSRHQGLWRCAPETRPESPPEMCPFRSGQRKEMGPESCACLLVTPALPRQLQGLLNWKLARVRRAPASRAMELVDMCRLAGARALALPNSQGAVVMYPLLAEGQSPATAVQSKCCPEQA